MTKQDEQEHKNKKYRIELCDWQAGEPEVTYSYFSNYKQAEKRANIIKLNSFQDVTIFDNQTEKELFFKTGNN